jgi:short-subunit dehydrogenase
MVEKIWSSYGKIDILVNNAGFGVYRSFLSASLDYIEEVMRVNFLGAVYCLKEVLPIMVHQREGWVVNVASVAGKLGTPKMGPYSASKFALIGLSESLDFELRPLGIHIAVVSPGPVKTNFRASYEEAASAPPKWLTLEAKDVSRAILKSLSADRFEIVMPKSLGVFAYFKAIAPRAARSLVHMILRHRQI